MDKKLTGAIVFIVIFIATVIIVIVLKNVEISDMKTDYNAQISDLNVQMTNLSNRLTNATVKDEFYGLWTASLDSGFNRDKAYMLIFNTDKSARFFYMDRNGEITQWEFMDKYWTSGNDLFTSGKTSYVGTFEWVRPPGQAYADEMIITWFSGEKIHYYGGRNG
jgi:hypothetical protein